MRSFRMATLAAATLLGQLVSGCSAAPGEPTSSESGGPYTRDAGPPVALRDAGSTPTPRIDAGAPPAPHFPDAGGSFPPAAPDAGVMPPFAQDAAIGADAGPPPPDAAMSDGGFAFVHPGALDSQQDLDFVKAKIQAGAQPWAGAFGALKGSSAATRTPNGLSSINSTNGDANTSRDDAIGAYAQALLWYLSGEKSYAESAIAILNSWAKLQGFTAGTDQDKLQAGWLGAIFAPAGEILRLYPGWAAGDITALQAMFRRAFYPELNTASAWNGNVDLTQIDAVTAIAVFNEDGVELELGIKRLRARVPSYFFLAPGPVPPIAGDGGNVQSFWSNPTQWVTGLQQESCRDNGHHAQFAIGSALHAAETAWHQGVDVYTEMGPRLMPALELLATQLLTGTMQGTCSNGQASPDRFDTWEVGYNHYHHRQGLPLPQTGQLIVSQIRPSAPSAVWNLDYETLTHAKE